MTSQGSLPQEICSTLPRWQVCVTLIAALIATAIFLWSIVESEIIGAAIGLALCIAFSGAFFDALTKGLWISDEHLGMRDRVFRVRRFEFGEIESIIFVADELFEVGISGGKPIAFPAGSRNLRQLSEALVTKVSKVRQIELRGELVDLDESLDQ